jgi:hypothetical protein
VARLIRNPADVFFYSGHGLKTGCLALACDCGPSGDYTCWATADDLKRYWKTLRSRSRGYCP